MFATKRLGKELQKLKQSIPPGITIVSADNFKEWQMDIKVLDANPIYSDQTYRLVFIFPDNYPIEPPEVTFLYVSPSPSSATQPDPNSTVTAATAATANNLIDLTSDDTTTPQSSSSITSSTTTHRPIPMHPHIYSNGIICLDLLGTQGWSPVQSVESVCMSIQSMLTGNSKNERPEGDADFVRSMGPRGKYGWTQKRYSPWGGGRGLRDVRFAYDDDTV